MYIYYKDVFEYQWQHLLKMVFCKKLFQQVCTFVQIRISCNQNIGETHTQTKKKSLFNVFITGESNLDERSGQLNRGAYILKLLLTKYHLQRHPVDLIRYSLGTPAVQHHVVVKQIFSHFDFSYKTSNIWLKGEFVRYKCCNICIWTKCHRSTKWKPLRT